MVQANSVSNDEHAYMYFYVSYYLPTWLVFSVLHGHKFEFQFCIPVLNVKSQYR